MGGSTGSRATVALGTAVLVFAGCGGGSPAPAAGASPAGVAAAAAACANPSGWKVIEPGEPGAAVFGTVEAVEAWRACAGAATGTADLSYRGGTGGIGVETAPAVYVVFWGSQWNNNDPSGEASILQSFYDGAGGSSWQNSVTQYCQGVPAGTVFCNGAGTPAGNLAGQVKGVWFDDGSAAPNHPRQSQLANEAVRAAQHFGNGSASSNASAQYVIATAHGYSSSGFGRQYCAWHSSTSSALVGEVAYTNLPYITDAGASCGANFNGLGPDAGITIVSGHELAETVTDQFPSGGWLDSAGSENGDKCAWIASGQGAAADVTFSTGTFPVQSLWSNAFDGGAGGCVLSYP